MRKLLIVAGLCALLVSALGWFWPGKPKPQLIYRLQLVAVDAAGGGDATISPDGKRFVTSSKRGGNWDVWMYDLTTAKWMQLTNDTADDFEAKLSPDSTKIVFCSTRTGQKDIWLLDVQTLALKQLTFSPEEDEYPSWSPDGKQIVYTNGPWGKRDFYVVPVAGGAPRKVSRQTGVYGACAFEPKGESLICHRYDLGSGDVIRIWLDDSEVSPLTIGFPWDYKPTTSPDGQWIAFSRAAEGPSQIFILPGAGGRARQLTATPYDDRWPTWNEKGDRLLFHRLVERGVAVKALDRRTGHIQTLVGEGGSPLQASFDPSARRVVYCSQTEDRKVLKVLDLDTGDTRLLTALPGEACFPRWSPDGESIAFAAKNGGRWEISVIQQDGTGLISLTEGQPSLHGMDGPLDWSPDSSKLIFQSDTKPFQAGIYVVDVKTKKLEPVTDGDWFDEAPSWSPDGKSFIFMSTRGGDWTWGFFRRALKGGAYERLNKPNWEPKNYPRMSKRGAMIWSAHNNQGIELLNEQVEGGKVRIIEEAGPGARWPSYSADGRWVLYTVVDHRVEYWIAENPLGVGSPALNISPASKLAQGEVTEESSSCEIAMHAVPLWRSPVDLHRR